MLASVQPPRFSPLVPHTASDSQRLAIEADPGPLLVLAGPGAGKTFCLIERIRFLVEQKQLDPARICAFTFTNKAAGEISQRLGKYLGTAAERIRRGTIHAFCAELLREFGAEVGLSPGFGIADEDYQLLVLRRIGVPERWRENVLKAFTSHRFIRGFQIHERDLPRYAQYSDILARRNLVDFDMLVLKTAELMRIDSVAETVRRRWDCVLVDEFQDLNPVQYRIVHALAKEHRNIFAVGDDDQSIYAWAGADQEVFRNFLSDFNLNEPKCQLAENRRCPREVIELASVLINMNTPLFAHRTRAGTERSAPFPITALKFPTAQAELEWAIKDLHRDRDAHRHGWENVALLYRKNEMGYAAEAQFLVEGVPCRTANGRAMADDPIVNYVVAALRVIADPADPIQQELFLETVLPRPLFDRVRAKAQEKRRTLLSHLERTIHRLPKDDVDGKKLRKGISALRNLAALAVCQSDIACLVDELLSQRVGQYRTMLEENHEDLSDPADHEEVQIIAARIAEALELGKPVWIPRCGGLEIALKGMLNGI
ncbi:MAG TPA: ATP-dependent helicase, partial [Gemmatimonadaceae bacterium]|nr:ATP-dependent helicase [Gemmatimonadaceae bacterium]